MAAAYRLAPDIHVCVTDEAAIFLDLPHNAYVGLDETQSRALQNLVEGWPFTPSTGETGSWMARELAESLRNQGLLTAAECGCGHAADPPLLPCAAEPLIEWDRMRYDVRCSHVMAFVRAMIVAAVSLRAFGMKRTVTRVSLRKRQGGGVPRFDLARAPVLVSAFYHIRPFFYAPKGRCLLDSLTLLEFLATYGLHPSWVIGVQVRPFVAHSWVQHERYVLNGTPEYVRDYRPILVV